eukprot:NODE_276_length_10970_cov_0.627909.p10 type:complete len:157 gc:universal NODE_276_length_10970_cov_0.627909:8498-8028(-)
MLNIFRTTVLVIVAIVLYYGFGFGGENELVRKSPQRKQAGTNYYYRRECNTISKMSVVFTDGPGFNKTYEFRKACLAQGIKCAFFVNPVTVDSRPDLKGQIDGLLLDGMEVGLAVPLYPADMKYMDESTFKAQLIGFAESVKVYLGGKYPKFVFFK